MNNINRLNGIIVLNLFKPDNNNNDQKGGKDNKQNYRN